jgi:hypothetical protein
MKLLFMVGLLTTTTALAGPQPREHDGFFLRLQPGIGVTKGWTERPNLRLSTSTLNLSFDVGGVAARNFVVFGRVYLAAPTRPTVDTAGGTTELVRWGGYLGGLGAGVSYYFADNFFATGALTLSRQGFYQAQGAGFDLDSSVGTGLHAGIGKEWWVSPNWALGVSLELLGGYLPDLERSSHWRVGGGVVQFSATYN